MKLKSFLVSIFLFLGIIAYAQNSLKVVDVAAGPGEKSKISIDLTNSDEVVGAEFTLTVPQGLILSEKESNLIESRKGDHAIYVNIEKNNPQNYHFIILSLTSTPFKENKGTLLEIPIEIPLNYQTGQNFNLNLSGVVLSSKNATDIGSNHANGKLTIASALYPDLAISGINSSESTITPNGKINIAWGVNNIGERVASGGWTEQISIISEKTGIEYLLGNVSYNEDLDKKKSISRNATFNLPKIIGIDGNVKIKINLIANPSVKEPDALKDNNQLISTNSILLEKLLYITLDKKSIEENATEIIRATLAQSGDRTTDNTFQITASQSNQLDYPATVKVPKDQSSVVFYIKPIDNVVADGNRTVLISAAGNNYVSVSEEIEIIDNEVSPITLTSSKTTATDGDSITITLQTDFAKNKDTKFNIATDNNSRWTVPQEVILPSGNKSISFTVQVKNNKTPEPTVIGEIIARSEGFQAGSAQVVLKSSNVPAFEFEISPETISKGDGVYATYAIIKRLDKSDVSVNIKLNANLANTLILPEIIEFPANVNQKKFNIGAVNNAIVDGTKTVNVTAEVYFSSCNCTLAAGSDGNALTKTITILDSNGPALLVKANPATIKAGQENSGKITITRNTTDTSMAILVKLSSDAPTILSIPATATIPIGAESVEITISTKIDTNKKGDQTIRIQAEADNFSSGFAWLLVTDQNKPDAIITKINTLTEAAGKENLEVTTTVTNQGFAIFTKGAKIEYYLSKDKSTKNATLLATAQLDKDIELGKSLDFLKSIPLPEQAGDYFLIVNVNSDQQINELSYINNEANAPIKLLSGYSATAAVAKSWYKSGEIITITGSAKMIDNSPASNRDVEITITNGSFVRSYKVKTDNSGSFAYDFEPLQTESGHYTVSAGYRGTKNTSQAEFDIIGFEWTNKPSDYLKWELVTSTPFKGQFKLKNNSKISLTNIKIELPADAGFSIQTAPLTLAAGQEAVLEYTLLADKPSEESKYYDINFVITANEGAKLNALAYYHCKAQDAKLIANPVSINTTMIKGSSRYYEFTITNTGAIDAEKVKIELPKLDWLKLKSASTIEKIAPNETATITLELIPTEKQQLNVPLTGSLAVNLSNGAGITVPFKIETVSESTGSLTIDVVDEYTYNTEKAPHLKGAKVIVRHPFSGAILAEGFTDENGLFKTGEIPEGYYTVTVTADKHETYQNNLLVDPGKTTTQKVFISYQAVSYEWTVKPTEIKDEYQSDLIVKFETNVPKPVLVIDIDDPLLQLEPGQSRMSYATITNHGLIATYKVDISVGSLDDYTLTPLITRIDVLNAKSSVIVPILITRSSSNSSKKAGGGGPCEVVLISRGTYFCETEQDVAAFKPYHTLSCPSSGPPGIPCVGPNCGNYPGGPGWGGLAPWAAVGDVVTSLPNFCDPCFLKVVKTVWSCTTSAYTVFKCVTAIGAAVETAGIAVPVAVYKCYKVVKSVTKCVNSFIEAYEACNKGGGTSKKAENSILEDTYQKMTEYEKFLIATQNSMQELFMEINPEAEGYEPFADYVIPKVEKQEKFSQSDITNIYNLVSGKGITQEEVLVFVTRWNSTVDAWSNGVFSPNASYPSIVDKNKLDQYAGEIALVEKYAKLKGYINSSEMMDATLKNLQEYIDEKSGSSSVCATVTVKFSQKITMTREAFEGTLTLNNGSDSNTIKNVNLDLIVKDEAGNDMTHLFQINKDAFLNGTGVVGPQSSQDGTVLFIPTKEAAPTVAKSYSFGGTLSYLDPNTNEKVTVQLYPVTLEVNPSPDLVLHYFMQRDIIGDDPLTEKVESMVPAEMALLIKNEGYGLAKNVQVASVQPEIIENKKGLLIDFEIIGSNFNNDPKQLGLLNVDFGNIEPQKAAIGQWWFTSTLLGHFIEYDLQVKHLSSYGNKNLSLIKASYVHELIKGVKAYGAGQDNIGDFLVNDIVDINDTPDTIYYSNGESDEVYKVSSANVSNLISPTQLTTTLTMNLAKTGWNYGNLSDPGTDKYKLEKVVRISDHLELPIENFWQTFVTLRDGADPKYENNLHFFDKISGVEKYTLYYTPINTNVPKVISFENVPATTTKALESVQVNFNKAINPSTFKSENIKLIHQGNTIAFNDAFIGKVNDSTYVLNIKTLAIASGYYELTVQCKGIKDLDGNEGLEGKAVSWVQIIGELGIVQFKTDQVQAQSVNSVEILFNKIVKPSQFTKDKLKLNGKSLDNISIVTENNLKYTIVGLAEYNLEKGEYELTVDLPNIKADDNTQGLIVQSQKWKVDLVLPEVQQFIPQFQGAVNSQNVTDMQIFLNKPIQNNFEANWINLYKGSVDQNVKFTVVKQDDLHYLISGLGAFTTTAGGYKLVIDQSNFTDTSGNFGNGNTSTMWTVKFDKPSDPINMHITPDRGISSTDNITSGNNLAIKLKITGNKQTIALYAITPASRVLVSKQYLETAGALNIPVNGYIGKTTFEAIAYDEYGNEGNPIKIDAYIDVLSFDGTINVIANSSPDCSETELKVLFTDEIVASEFTKDALIIKSSGINISNEDVKINKISDLEFRIENLNKFRDTGDITIGVDLSKVHKKSSGLQGNGIVSKNVGALNNVLANISGDLVITETNSTTTYTATPNMQSYNWTVTGGEIVSETNSAVTIKWTEKGSHDLSLTYITPGLCTKTASIKIIVDATLSIEDKTIANKNGLIIAPVPNNGSFTLSLNGAQGTFMLEIYDVGGRIVYKQDKINVTDNFKKEVHTNLRTVGVYYLILHNSETTYKSKFIIK